jgi:hypothetical protein
MEVEMTEHDDEGTRREGFQNSLTHEGVPADGDDSNQRADDKVTVLQPDGEPVPRWWARRKR